MSKTNIGPVLIITKDLINKTYFDVLDHMIKEKMLKPSSKLLIESFLNSYNILTDFIDEGHVYIRPFASFDMLIGKPNPDLKSNAPLKMSTPSKYKRLRELKDLGFITNHPKKNLPSFYQHETRTVFYKLQFPTITLASHESLEQCIDHRSTEYKSARKIEAEMSEQLPFAFTSQLKEMGTYELLANFISTCIRPEKSVNLKTIKKEFPTSSPNKGETGVFKITTTTLETSEIIVAEDMVLIDYLLSGIIENIKNQEPLQTPVENRFRFDFATILMDFDIDDSGGYREALSKQFNRIFATTFNIDACSKALWLMEKLGFVDEQGNPYDSVSIRFLTPIGQRSEDKLDDDVIDILKGRKVNRYIDVALPPHLIQQINKSLGNGDRHLIPMFSRDKYLIQQKDSGLPWLLASFLSKHCPRPGFKHGPIELKSFCSGWMKAWEGKEEARRGVLSMLKMLLQQGRLLYVEGLTNNTRNQPRLNLLYAKIDKFLIRVVNTTPEKYQLNSIIYEFLAVKLSDAEIRESDDRIALVKEHSEYAQDEMYKKLGNNIIARADVVAGKYRYKTI